MGAQSFPTIRLYEIGELFKNGELNQDSEGNFFEITSDDREDCQKVMEQLESETQDPVTSSVYAIKIHFEVNLLFGEFKRGEPRSPPLVIMITNGGKRAPPFLN